MPRPRRSTFREAIIRQLTLLGLLFAGVHATSADTLLHARSTAIPGASGKVALEPAGSKLYLEVTGLTPGLYTVSAQNTNNLTITIGVFPIFDPTLAPDRQTQENMREDSLAHESDQLASRVECELPAGVNTSELKRVSVVGPGGNLLLEAKLR